MIKMDITLQRDSFSISVSQSWPARGISALFGASGCGKSSVLRCLAGLEPDCRGFISVNGEVWQDDQNGVFLKPSQRSVALAFQKGALFPHMNVRDNLEFGLRRKGRMRKSLSVDEVIEMFDLQNLLERRPAELSGGETQRVSIGRTLLAHPSVLLLDEPMTGLDFQRKNEILPFLDRLHRELDIPVIYVSHLPGEVMRLADYLVLMQDGKIRTAGPIEEVLLDNRTPKQLQNKATTIVPGKVEKYDAQLKQSTIATSLGTFSVPSKALTANENVQLTFSADAVQINAQTGSLIAKVEGCSSETDGRVLHRYRIGDQCLYGRSAVASIDNYPLQPGSTVSLTILASLLEVSAAP